MSKDVKDIAKNLQGVDAPYNFVPLNRTVCILPHASRVSQDLPFSDGISGKLGLEIEVVTPTCPGNLQDRPEGDQGPAHVRPMKLYGGRYGISGSSLRGMMRSVLEIATFSRMSRYDNPFLSLRDLAGPVSSVYRERMVDGGTGGKPFRYRGHAGWLQQDESGNWSIMPCKMARVFHKDLHEVSGGRWRGFEPMPDEKGKYTRGASAREKYELWLQVMDALDVRHRPNYRTDQQSNIEAWYADSVGADGGKTGVLVFSGQPGGYPRSKIDKISKKKRVEFIFFDADSDTELPVDEDVLKAFFQINKDSDHWDFLKSGIYQSHVRKDAAGGRFPVFYLTEDNDPECVSAMGLSMMFRLPYRNDFRHAVTNADADHVGSSRDDFGSLLFGHIGSEKVAAMKGRVAFGNAFCVDESVALEEHRMVLNSPKPSFYPAYLRQPGSGGCVNTGRGPGYRTLENDDVELRGRKRYPARPGVHPRDAASGRLDSVLHCFPSGLRFRGSTRLHNLRPIELGALLWCFDFGGSPGCVHSIGAGRPYGFGQVRVKVTEHVLRRVTGECIEPADCVRQFVDFMEDWARRSASQQLNGGWLRSEVIQNLLAMANQDNAGAWMKFSGCRLRYLGEELEDNQMPQLHQQVKNLGLKLPAYAESVLSDASEESSEAARKWLGEALDEIVSQHKTDPVTALRSKLLVERVAEISDEALKRDVVVLIRSNWEAQGWWDSPPSGKATKRARKFYGDCLES